MGAAHGETPLRPSPGVEEAEFQQFAGPRFARPPLPISVLDPDARNFGSAEKLFVALDPDARNFESAKKLFAALDPDARNFN